MIINTKKFAQDITFAVEEMELTAQQARNLSNIPFPLGIIYDRYIKYQSAYMEEIREVICDTAEQ